MNIAIVGCGHVAENYRQTLGSHPELKLVGAYDQNAENLRVFCRRWSARAYNGFDELLDDPAVGMVLNLTSPRSHYEVTERCLRAGKHVYSEKPLAMTSASARELVALANEKDIYLSAAPCSVLGETAQTIWKALVDGAVGRVRLVYANFDDGMIAPTLAPWLWRNEAGVAWPAKDEFEVGCTFEHAGYVLTWLAAFFGPALSVTGFAACQIPDKGIPVDSMAPDFTVGGIQYSDGIVARVTCGLVAPRDKSIMVVGDEGVIYTQDVRDDAGPVFYRRIPSIGMRAAVERRLNSLRGWLESALPAVPWSGNEWHFRTKYPFARKPSRVIAGEGKRVDFCRGPAELAAAIREQRPCRLSAALGRHIREVLEALQYPERFGSHRKIESTFEPMQPLPWEA